MSFSSPANTVTHSAKARFVVTTVAPPLVAVGDQIKEQLATGAVKRHEAELVDDERVHAEEPLLQSGELAAVAGFNQLPHEIGSPREEDASFLFQSLRPRVRSRDGFCPCRSGRRGSDSPVR